MRSRQPQRLAIVGCGSSGLITLKYALEFLPDWEVAAFEASDSITGCWGSPYRGFVSTSTRFATQFACFPQVAATMHEDRGASRSEFFREGEYGEYLESFADHFQLRPHIQLQTRVTSIAKQDNRWSISIEMDSAKSDELFDAVVVCTGLAEQPKPIDSDAEQLSGPPLNRAIDAGDISGKKIVVIGGGESAVDIADRLASLELNNEVYLSLHSGIRVSPRYHPVRGVPSDFLRNRLMLSADPDMRNWLGEVFVRLRIRYEKLFRRIFRAPDQAGKDHERLRRRKEWDLRLTMAAKDDLFNMFHNKSDDFLDAVGDERIQIVGPPADSSGRKYFEFGDAKGISGNSKLRTVDPDLVVPAIGYTTAFDGLFEQPVALSEMHLGCIHESEKSLFLVGFARPIIGNIPTISEMQARLVCQTIAGMVPRVKEIRKTNQREREELGKRHPWLDQNRTYPVEMFPYCDLLARMMGMRSTASFFSSPFRWLRHWLQPATTLHYFEDRNKAAGQCCDRSPVYVPPLLIGIILAIKPFDWLYRVAKRGRKYFKG